MFRAPMWLENGANPAAHGCPGREVSPGLLHCDQHD
jgi:hypothetical protein